MLTPIQSCRNSQRLKAPRVCYTLSIKLEVWSFTFSVKSKIRCISGLAYSKHVNGAYILDLSTIEGGSIATAHISIDLWPIASSFLFTFTSRTVLTNGKTKHTCLSNNMYQYRLSPRKVDRMPGICGTLLCQISSKAVF